MRRDRKEGVKSTAKLSFNRKKTTDDIVFTLTLVTLTAEIAKFLSFSN